MIVSFQIKLRTKRACNFHTKNGADSNINFNGTGTIEKVDISHIWKEFAFQYLYQLKIMKSYDVYTNMIFQTFRVSAVVEYFWLIIMLTPTRLVHFKMRYSELAWMERGGAGWTGPGLGLSNYRHFVIFPLIIANYRIYFEN